nr:hypothetical protein [uncultured Carboxylicivirga sp.]
MKSIKLLLALFLGATISFTSCSSDDELTPEEQEAKQTEELLATISANYDEITSKEWSYKEFQPSDDMLAASQTDDGYVAKAIIAKAEQAKNFGLVVSFAEDGNKTKVDVAINVPDDELEARLIAFSDAQMDEPLGFLYDIQEYFIATVRRVVAAPFAADDLEIEDIVDEATGECILSISASNFSSLSYDDLVLSQRKLIEGNSDKVYLNEDGTLTVEVTSEDYGVSKYIFAEATE